MKGKLICLYGINNIGKSTQVGLLVEALKAKGLAAEYLKYPRYDVEPSGPFINMVLRTQDTQQISEQELQMWYTINRFQFQPQLEAMLAAGTIVVAEDYIGTGLAWGSTKGVPLAWLQQMNEPLLHEDLAILLDGERFTSGTEEKHLHEQNDVLMKLCRKIHRELGKIFDWTVVDANRKQEVIAQEILGIVEDFLQK